MKNRSAASQDIVVIGTSAGGMQALIELLNNIPEGTTATLLIVQHIPAHADSQLATILDRHCVLPVRNARHEAPLEPATVYTAVADRHLLVEQGRMLLTNGPAENRFRPSVDSLFRSAAYAYRERVLGVVLSGSLNDGTSGLWSVKHLGGTTVIQSPDQAMFSSMPTSAARYVEIDHELSCAEIGRLIGQRSQQQINQHNEMLTQKDQEEFIRFEIEVAKGADALKGGVLRRGVYSPLTCPECSGAMTEYRQGGLVRYRCHTGHAHTAESLMAGIDENVEKSLWKVMRGLEEGMLLLGHLAEEMESLDRLTLAEQYRNRAASMERRSQAVKRQIFRSRPINPVLTTTTPVLE